MSSRSVVVLGLCEATWGEEFPQHEGQRGRLAKHWGAQTPSSPSEACATEDLNLEEVVLSVRTFHGNSFTRSCIRLTVCWMLW